MLLVEVHVALLHKLEYLNLIRHKLIRQAINR